MKSIVRTGLLAIALLLIGAAASPAASRLVIRGAGFGHGVGMSQYGAMGFAKQGRSHADILGHYFTGTRLGRLGGAAGVRVLLKSSSQIAFSGASGVAGSRSLDPALTYNVTRGVGGVVVLRSASGRDLGTYQSPLTIGGADGGLLLRGPAENDVTDGRYRGNLEIRAGALGGLSAINALDMEEYLRGVVPGEVPANWPDEALRAQAVAARTYAVATSKPGDGFDQYADVRSQVYKGIAVERPTTDASVRATRGEVVIYGGKPIVTYYFSTSGGRTEDVENSFLGAEPAPWLKSVEDPFDSESPRHRWVVRMSLGQAKRRLGGLVRGGLRRIRVLRRGTSPRVVRAQIVGTGGRRSASGPQLRSRLRLFDTWARFTVITANVSRGDGSTPREPASDGGTGGGGTRPRVALAFGAAHRPVLGTLSGRVASDRSGGRWVVVQRLAGRRWVAQFEAPVRADGFYSARVRAAGSYRIRYAGEAGPRVRVR